MFGNRAQRPKVDDYRELETTVMKPTVCAAVNTSHGTADPAVPSQTDGLEPLHLEPNPSQSQVTVRTGFFARGAFPITSAHLVEQAEVPDQLQVDRAGDPEPYRSLEAILIDALEAAERKDNAEIVRHYQLLLMEASIEL